MIDNVFFGLGIDCHSLEKGTGIIIGGYEIKCNLKSVAHSDGDVLTHAIIDALCGALNLGDIGQHFPNTPNNKNISSIELLKKIHFLLKDRGMTINGVKKFLKNKETLELDEISNRSINKLNIRNKVTKISNLVKNLKKLK